MKLRVLLALTCLGLSVFPQLISATGWKLTKWTTAGFVQSLTVNGSTLLAGTDGTGVFITRDNGDSWGVVNVGLTTKNILSLSGNGSDVFAGTTAGAFRSTDAGVTWSAMNSTSFNKQIQTLAINGADLFAGTPSGLYLTTNNGTSWSVVSAGLTDSTIYTILTNGKNMFAGTRNGVYMSTNGGGNWSAANNGIQNKLVYSLAMNNGKLFAGTYYDGVFASADNGSTWSSSSAGLKSDYINALAAKDGKLFAGTYNGVYSSVDNGKNWRRFNVGLTDTTILSLSVNESYLFAGTSRQGVWRVSLDEVSVEPQEIREIDNHAFAMNVMSNPYFNIVVHFTLKQPDRARISIYDLKGRALSLIADRRFDSGVHYVSFIGNSLARGCYTVKIQTGGFSAARRVLLID